MQHVADLVKLERVEQAVVYFVQQMEHDLHVGRVDLAAVRKSVDYLAISIIKQFQWVEVQAFTRCY